MYHKGASCDPACSSLFLIYISDLPDTLTKQTRLFADDTAAYKVVTCPDDQTQLQRDLNQLAEWEKRWDMAFHPGKRTSLPVTRSRKPLEHQYELHGHMQCQVFGCYHQQGHELEQAHQQRLHKSQQDPRLPQEKPKISSGSMKIKEMAYKSYVRPALEYACTVLDPHSQHHTDRTDAVQRRAARFVMRRYRTPGASAMIDDLKLTSLQDRRKTARLAMLYRIHSIIATDGIKCKRQPPPPRQR